MAFFFTRTTHVPNIPRTFERASTSERAALHAILLGVRRTEFSTLITGADCAPRGRATIFLYLTTATLARPLDCQTPGPCPTLLLLRMTRIAAFFKTVTTLFLATYNMALKSVPPIYALRGQVLFYLFRQAMPAGWRTCTGVMDTHTLAHTPRAPSAQLSMKHTLDVGSGPQNIFGKYRGELHM
jgi:hypothetical protein